MICMKNPVYIYIHKNKNYSSISDSQMLESVLDISESLGSD